MAGGPSATGDDPDRMDDAGDVAAERQQDVDPELEADPDLEKHAERRQQDGQKNSQQIQFSQLLDGQTTGTFEKRGCSPAPRKGAAQGIEKISAAIAAPLPSRRRSAGLS